MNLLSNQYELDFLKNEFVGMEFESYTSNDGGFLNCIACWCNTAQEVISNWKGIQSFISAYFKPPGDFAKWNVYLVIFCAEEIPLYEKYIIQNDRYAARKIILDNLVVLPDSSEAALKVGKELLGTDLSLKEINSSRTHKVNIELAKLVNNVPMDMSISSKNKRTATINCIIEYVNKNEN